VVPESGSADPAEPSAPLAAAIDAIDAVNAEDPTIATVRGRVGPKELLHAQLVTEWVRALDRGASDVQLAAARAHHLRRWAHPRSEYPAGRAGYLRWRAAAKRRHAEEVAGLLEDVGWDRDRIEAVQRLVRKEGLGSEAAVQVHEDALCLVFLETQLADVAAELGEEHTTEVLRKTLAKMSPAGLAAAANLELSGPAADLLSRALGDSTRRA